jgi:F-type H+-transporting ATPase subunit delta
LLGLVEQSAVPAVRQALEAMGDAIRHTPALTHVMASPAFDADQKTAVLTGISNKLQSPPVLIPFLAQLVKTNRVGFLPEIAEAFAALADQEKGTRQVSVTAARPLSAQDQQQLKTRLREQLRQDVDVAFHTDPALLSGLQVRIGSMVYDSSVRTRLTAMRMTLTKE